MALLMTMPVPRADTATANACPGPLQLAQTRVDVISQTGTHQLTVEIADSAPARAAGLMCRSALAENTGMLFVYPRPQIAKMWMKNTYIPLDMLFIADDGRIVKIAADLAPGQEKRIKSGVRVTAVLELPAGTAARHGIRIGDRLSRTTRED